MRLIRRGGPYLRVAEPDWDDPLDGGFAAERGGRWNPPESFPVVYLCRSIEVARANVYRKLAGQPYGPEDLRPGSGPVLVRTTVPEDRYLNVITDAGCRDAGLPATYPLRQPPPDRALAAVPADRPAGLGGGAARGGRPERRAAAVARSSRTSGGASCAAEPSAAFEDWFWS